MVAVAVAGAAEAAEAGQWAVAAVVVTIPSTAEAGPLPADLRQTTDRHGSHQDPVI